MSTISLRVEKQLHDLIEDVAHKRGQDISSFVRLTLKEKLARLNQLSEDERVALGLKERKED